MIVYICFNFDLYKQSITRCVYAPFLQKDVMCVSFKKNSSFRFWEINCYRLISFEVFQQWIYLLLSIFVKSSSKPYMYSSERVCTLCMIKLIISISLYFFHHGVCSKKNPKQFLFHAVVNSLFCCYAQGTYITVCMILLCALLIIYTCYMNVYIYLLFYIPSLNNKHGWLVVLSFNTTHH